MEKLEKHYAVDIRWRAFELRPAGTPPMTEAFMQYIATARPKFERVAREQYGLEIDSGPFGINSHAAHVAAHYAVRMGVGAAYHNALLRAYWLEARDISDAGVLVELGEKAGLSAEGLRAALADADYDNSVKADIYQAQLLGLDGVPALIFAKKYLVSGAQPYDVLARIVEQLQAKVR
ncbi:MAG: DsbA family protein [Chloroflexi bacterium]|nr:DsbA family protein [Chloroflexota bacterium]